MTAAMWRVSLRKELRALLPMWAVCMLALGAFAVDSTRYFLLPFGIFIYGLGSIGLGSYAMGHEYGHRTVGILLSQPVDRRKLLLIKLAVLTPLLVALTLAAYAGVIPAMNATDSGQVITVRTCVVIGLLALCVAPALTMLCRSGIAGMVFTLGVAGVIALASAFLGPRSSLPAALWLGYLLLMLCGLAAAAGWRYFTRLEAIDSGGREWHLPHFMPPSAAAAVTDPPSRHPVIRLIGKELRLQQLTFVVAAMGIVTIAGLVLRQHFNPVAGADAIMPVALVYAGSVPLLIGALASAEERRMGTLNWQLLMPVHARTQFAVKAAVVIALALPLSLGVPALATWLSGAVSRSGDWFFGGVYVVLLASASLYVSSLNTSGIRSVMMAMPAILLVFVASNLFSAWVFARLVRVYMWTPESRPYLAWLFGQPTYEMLRVGAAAVVLAAVLLRFAYRNHVSAERAVDHVRRQAGWIAGVILLDLVFLMLSAVL